MEAIRVENLSKVFKVREPKGAGAAGWVRSLFRPVVREVFAVKELSFTIQEGERVGLIGVNGAGKSTTIKMLTGILNPTSGRVEVLGLNPQAERVRTSRHISAVFGQRSQLWWDLPYRDSLALIGLMYGMPPVQLAKAAAELTEALRLGDLLDKPVRTMSLGQKMRAELGAALIHKPRIAFLDEPTIGLDVLAKQSIREVILERNTQDGMTIFLTSHDIEDLERVADRIIVIDSGEKLFDGSIVGLKRRFGSGRTIEVQLASPMEPSPMISLPDGATEVAHSDGKLVIRVDPDRSSPAEVIVSLLGQIDFVDFSLIETDLSHVISRIASEGKP
jgi:ABC transporter related